MGYDRRHARVRRLQQVSLAVLLLTGVWLSRAASDDLAEAMVAAGLVYLQERVEAPDFQLLTPDGAQIRLSDFRGRPVLLNFWTTW